MTRQIDLKRKGRCRNNSISMCFNKNWVYPKKPVETMRVRWISTPMTFFFLSQCISNYYISLGVRRHVHRSNIIQGYLLIFTKLTVRICFSFLHPAHGLPLSDIRFIMCSFYFWTLPTRAILHTITFSLCGSIIRYRPDSGNSRQSPSHCIVS